MHKAEVTEAFIYIPNINELRSIICESYPSDSRISPVYHCNYICRLLLTKIPDILVAPNYINNTIYIIYKKNELITEKININYLMKKLKILDSLLLSPDIYEMCLTYSVLTKVTPKWMRIDKYYVKSQDFIQYKESLNGVEVNITKYNDTVIHLQLLAVNVHITPYFEPKTCIPNCWKHYSESKNGCINIPLSQQIYVLPSMKKGNIISIFKSINENSIKEYWLNQHGYLLPNETELSYCKVQLSQFDHDYMVYPSICLLSKPLYINENNITHRETIASFLKVFIKNNLFICGEVVELMGKLEFQNLKSKDIVQNCDNEKEDIIEEESSQTENRYEWEECEECSKINRATQNYSTVVTIPFDFESVKSIDCPALLAKAKSDLKRTKRIKNKK